MPVDTELAPAEREALDAWDAVVPPDGFSQRVLAVAAAREVIPASGPWWRVLLTGRGLALLVVAVGSTAVAAGSLLSRGQPPRELEHVPANPVGAMEGAGQGLEPEQGSGDAVPFPDDMRANIDAYVESYGRLYGDGFRFHGVVLVARQGVVAYERAFGSASLETREPNTVATRFRFGSLTAQLTAAAVLQLEAQGELSVTDPLGKYVEGLDERLATTVQLHHLLSHTSGIFNFTDHVDYFGWRAHAPESDEIIAAALQVTARDEPVQPGTDFNPSNTGYLLLGEVIESVTGVPLHLYLAQNILVPAKMEAVTWGDAYDGGQQAVGYTFREETEDFAPATGMDPRMFGGAGALVGTARDLLAWDRALYGGQVLSPQDVERMYTPVQNQYGYAWVVGRSHGQRVVSHPGGIEGFNASMLRFLGDQTFVVVLSNTEVLDARTLASNISDIAYGKSVSPHPEYEEVPADPKNDGRYISAWKLTPAARQELVKQYPEETVRPLEHIFVVREEGHLLLDLPMYGSKWMHAMGPDTFFFKDEPGTTTQFGWGRTGRWMTVTQGARKLLYVPDADPPPAARDPSADRRMRQALFGG